MNSINALLFLALQQYILSLRYSNGTPVIRTVDHDLGFLEDDMPPLSYPAVLIDMSSFNFTNYSEHVQKAEGIITCRLVFAPYSGTNNHVPVDFVKKGLQYYEIEHIVHKALHTWSPQYLVDDSNVIPDDIFGSLIRTATKTDTSRRDLRVRNLSYRLAYEDYSTQRVIEYVAATLGLQMEMLIPGADEIV
jgi:hypothetical protein